MNVVAVPIIESNTELQGTRHSSMTARNVGGTTDRNSLSARQANGAAMLVEVDAAAVAVLRERGLEPRERVLFIERYRRGHLQDQARGSR